MADKIDVSALAGPNGPSIISVPLPTVAVEPPQLDVSDDPAVVAAVAAVAQAEAEHEALTRRMATDDRISPGDLRAAEDAVTFARRKLEGVVRHAREGRRLLIREQLRQLHARARKLAGNVPARIREATRLHMARDEADRGISADNAECHAISEALQRLAALAEACGEDLGAIAGEVEIGGLEAHSHRLQGGVKVGEFEVGKHPQPQLVGGYDPGLLARVAPVPPLPVVGISCTDSDGRGFKSHVTIWLTDPSTARHYLHGLYCERCKRRWTKAQALAEWGMAYEPPQSLERVEALGTGAARGY